MSNSLQCIVAPISFVMEPLVAVYELYTIDRYKKAAESIERMALKRTYNEDTLKDDLPVIEKIKDFIHYEAKLDKINIKFFKTRGQTNCAAANGSPENCGILINESYWNEMKENFTNKHKFIIAHELGHIINHDSAHYLVNKEKCWSISYLAIYALSISLFSKTSMNYFTVHLLSCTVASAVAFILYKNHTWSYEYRADRFAAQISPEIATAGIEFMQESRKLTLEVHEETNEAITSQIDCTDSVIYKTYLIILQKIAQLTIDEKGDSFFLEHPRITSRIQAIEPYCQKNLHLKQA